MKLIHKSVSFNKKTFTPETLITISLDGYQLEDFRHIKSVYGEDELALILGLRLLEIIEGTNPDDVQPTRTPLAGSLDALTPVEGPVTSFFNHMLTEDEREAFDRAFWKSVEVVDEGIDATEKCPNALLPDGPVCPRCGGRRGPSGVDGGSWVHF